MRTLLATALLGALTLSACGSNTADQHPGQAIARQKGCAGCHGSSGQGQVGPAFVGLYQSEVELDDGTTVIADEDYLRLSITDPKAQVVDGFNVPMPTTNLSDSEIDQIVAYIISLAEVEQ